MHPDSLSRARESASFRVSRGEGGVGTRLWPPGCVPSRGVTSVQPVVVVTQSKC